MSSFPAPGSRLGPYRVVRELGRGGMGVVLEAVDEVLARRVALKVISPELAGNPGFRARFTREAQAQASLESPHVVTVYAHGEVDDRLFMATRLIPGGDLGSWLRDHGTPPPQEAVELIAQVASGLADAHSTGLVHRDIKPANVLLRFGQDGVTAYLADFGIAHRVGTEPGRSAPGAVPGTPGYLAPELHDGGAPAPTSDVYALGCLLWATLVGRPPEAHRSGPAPQLSGAGRWQRALNPVLRAALATEPADRYPTAAELRDALQAVLRRTAPRWARLRLAAGALGVAASLVATAAGAGFVLTGGDQPRRADDRPVAPGHGEVRTADEIASALAVHGAVRQFDAACVARRLLHRTGIDGLVDAGLLDSHHQVITTNSDDLDRTVVRDVVRAGMSCILGAPDRGAR